MEILNYRKKDSQEKSPFCHTQTETVRFIYGFSMVLKDQAVVSLKAH